MMTPETPETPKTPETLPKTPETPEVEKKPPLNLDALVSAFIPQLLNHLFGRKEGVPFMRGKARSTEAEEMVLAGFNVLVTQALDSMTDAHNRLREFNAALVMDATISDAYEKEEYAYEKEEIARLTHAVEFYQIQAENLRHIRQLFEHTMHGDFKDLDLPDIEIERAADPNETYTGEAIV